MKIINGLIEQVAQISYYPTRNYLQIQWNICTISKICLKIYSPGGPLPSYYCKYQGNLNDAPLISKLYKILHETITISM